MNNIEIENSLDLLEKLLNNDTLNLKMPNININKLSGIINKSSTKSSTKSSSDSESYSSVPDDSITVGKITIPSEIWINNDKKYSSSQSHFNMANISSNILSQNSNKAGIINI
jgi:hypothetical protein